MSLTTRHSSLLFSAGDLSGDIHLARLAGEVLSRHASTTIHALGGAHLKDAGAQILRDTSGFGVIGFSSALKLVPRALKIQKVVAGFLQTQHIDAAVLCDWGAFNVRLLPILKAHGIPILYYFPPRSWQRENASNPKKNGTEICEFVDRVATPFQWSAQKLAAADCNATWVGHPLLEIVDEARRQFSRAALRRQWGAGDEDFLIAILPGSRDMELDLLAPQLAGAARLLQREYSNARFVVAVARGASQKVHHHFAREKIDVRIVEERATQVLLACDAAWVKSGTATLEAAVCDAPQIVCYDLPPLLRAQWKWTGLQKKVAMIAMPNIIANRKIVPEVLGDECRPTQLAAAMSTLLQSHGERDAMRLAYQGVRAALGADLPYTATRKTADLLDEMLAARIVSSG